MAADAGSRLPGTAQCHQCRPTRGQGCRIDALNWNGERLFQAARFVTEMQYQHLVFEEFARKVQPNVDPFIFTNSADLDPSIVAEFAHVVYRFGHSMLSNTVDRLTNQLTSVDGDGSTRTDRGVPQSTGVQRQWRDRDQTRRARSFAA